MSDYECPQCFGTGRVWLMAYGAITEQRNDTCPLCNGSGKRKPTYEELESELKQLREYKADVENSTRMAMDEMCKGEKHCTCVPLLRLEIKRLNGIMDVRNFKRETHTISKADQWLILAIRILSNMDREDVAEGLENEFDELRKAALKGGGE